MPRNLLLLALAVLALGCGSPPDDRHVSIVLRNITARTPAPEVTLVVDRSEASAALLPELGRAVAASLERHPQAARWSLVALPADHQCGAGPVLLPPLQSTEDDPDALVRRTREVSAALQALTPAGSASITATLASLLDPEVDLEREHFIVLVTASEPACPGDGLQVVQLHRQQLRKTVVVTFGPRVSASPLLESMASAGGFARNCHSGCSAGDACTATGECGRATWHAADGAELETVFDALLGIPSPAPDICSLLLPGTPRSADRVKVFVDNKLLEPETGYTLNGDRAEVLGEPCARLQRSSTKRPVLVQLWVDLTP